MSLSVSEQSVCHLTEDYLLFLDESGNPHFYTDLSAYDDPSNFPVLTVAALIVKKNDYENILQPGLQEITEKYWPGQEIYLHSREIRRKVGAFGIFMDEDVYSKFKQDMCDLFAKASIRIISSSINKANLLRRAISFEASTGTPYNIGDLYLRDVEYVLERAGHLLHGQTGKIIFESKGAKESRRIQGLLDQARSSGTFYTGNERFSSITDDIQFYTKEDRICGLQLVDYCIYPFARHAKNPTDPDNKFFEILKGLVYPGDYGMYGLKEWP